MALFGLADFRSPLLWARLLGHLLTTEMARTLLEPDLQFYWLALPDGAFWSCGFQKSSPLG
jgi:hypothetical protein